MKPRFWARFAAQILGSFCCPDSGRNKIISKEFASERTILLPRIWATPYARNLGSKLRPESGPQSAPGFRHRNPQKPHTLQMLAGEASFMCAPASCSCAPPPQSPTPALLGGDMPWLGFYLHRAILSQAYGSEPWPCDSAQIARTNSAGRACGLSGSCRIFWVKGLGRAQCHGLFRCLNKNRP